ncbi:MAG: DUF488 family protein [Rhodospirillaceae bacterium]|jgi:uncharacterized protein YeaO (DUF488 family)|nr:DUF488 family protein [Rhodospirillaceae bacterium]MBT5455946.1 DUF488 family protein [Rhodospirillaceae bacterium]
MPFDIRLKRAYDSPDSSDGKRILVERLWPRGVTKEAAALHEWMKDIAPSADLRKWYGHEPDRWPEFQKRYERELADNRVLVGDLRAMCAAGPVTLIFAARDEARNSAVVLKAVLEQDT